MGAAAAKKGHHRRILSHAVEWTWFLPLGRYLVDLEHRSIRFDGRRVPEPIETTRYA